MSRDENQGGFAMVTVIMSMGALVFILILVYQLALADYQNSQYERREDTILVGAEAMLDRYAAKLTIDPLYYRHFVDEAELPRRCDDPTSPHYGTVVQPGEGWHDDCPTWDYEEPASFFAHPLLEGNAAVTADDVVSLLTVDPAGDNGGIEVTVVSRQEEFGQTRAVTAEIAPESIAEFVFLVEDDLRFGSGAVLRGKVYTGGDLDFRTAPVQGIVHRDVFAEGWIGHRSGYGPPIFMSGAQGYDGHGEYLDIRSVYPDALDFDKFWDDLDLIRNVACNGGGLCLSHSMNPGLGLSQNPTAWLIEPIVVGDTGRLKVSAAYSNHSYSCVSSEEWWWLHSDDATWSLVGTFDIPANGAVWIDGHTIIGQPGQTSTIRGQVTLYAGNIGSRRNIIMASDIVYAGAGSGTDVLGLIASDEAIVDPASVGGDKVLNLAAAILAQNGSLQVARDCGDGGDPLVPDPANSTLNFFGSRAARVTGDVAAHFGTRNYDFDPRLEQLRPPLFPLMKDTWDYVGWREGLLPCWAREPGAPGCE